MNIFSGARRIALIIGIIIAISGIFQLATVKPNVTLHYSIATYGAPAVAASDCDISESASKRLSFKTKNGDPLDVQLCFLAAESTDGRMLVPYTEEDGQIFMNDRYSKDVTKYVDAYADKAFGLSDTEVAQAEAAYSAQYWQTKGEVIGGFGFGLILFWLSVWAIGWIVRGFMGIPIKQDHKNLSTELQK